jgi:hypothetical protein
MPPTKEPNNGPDAGRDFERRVEKLLEAQLPHCYLSAVPVFPADQVMSVDMMANELDFVVHLKQGDTHVLLIVECKACRVSGDEDGRSGFSKPTATSPWMAHYPEGPSDVKKQLRAQRKALVTNFEPIEGVLHVYGVVVADRPDGLDLEPGFVTTQDLPFFEDLTLVRADRFERYLYLLLKGATPFRVQQSEILRRIRLGQPVAALGHPEINNAIEYCRRCRSFIDSEIFHHLDFKPERWAINGSAGMGKSVLLVYATMALITERRIGMLKDGTRFLQSTEEHSQKIGLAPLEKRHVWVVAHTDKQRKMLEQMFARFNDIYSNIDPYIESRRVKPQFRVFGEISAIDDCNVLLVDEAHDLGPDWESRVRQWHESQPGNYRNYLVIACDRHQKLRLSKDDARMITGINFSLCTTKLRRNYRNPFPAYAGSLGLLFRWFTSGGPKILPKVEELTEAFGFAEVINETADRLLLRSRNDAHPANNWSHVLSSFPSAAAAYQQLAEFPLRKDQVLWIRFTPEESGVNYENLQRWSYHSVHGTDAPDILDKYVKGQEFAVVVIEGVPKMFSWSAAAQAFPNDLKQARIEMWQARRLVYLAASRANVFLYFILPPHTASDVAEEFRLMFSQLGRHLEQASPSGTLWELRVSKLGDSETLDDYLDAIEAETVVPPETAASANEAKAAMVDAVIQMADTILQQPSSSIVAEPATTSPKEIKPVPVAAASQDARLANLPTSTVKPSIDVPKPNGITSASPVTVPKLGMIAISDLSTEIRRPVKVIINILKNNGFRDLANNSQVNREIALRILRRTDSGAQGIPTKPRSTPAVFNSLAEQLDEKAQNLPKQKPDKS